MGESTSNPTPKISRRDAIKLLAALAGSAALANLPSKWSRPELQVGILPVHAQTSGTRHTMECNPDDTFTPDQGTVEIISGVTIDPPDANIELEYFVEYLGATDVNKNISPITPISGTATTNASGYASTTIQFSNSNPGDLVVITWNFVNASDGTDTDSQTFTGEAIRRTLLADPDDSFMPDEVPVEVTSVVTIDPPAANIEMAYSVDYRDVKNGDKSPWLNTPASGTAFTNNAGVATTTVNFNNSFDGDTVTVTWSFVNVSDGTGTDDQVFTGITPP